MPTHENVNRPVRTSKATLPRRVVDVDLLDPEDDFTWPREAEQALVRDDALVEEVSIDGMCGVY